MRIDAHHHLWRLSRGDYTWLTSDLTELYKDFEPADLKPLLDEAGIHGTIVVQAADSVAETEFLLSLSETHDWILGVVGWVDMEAPDAVATIERLAAHNKFVGLRPMIQDIEDDRWMLRDSIKPALDCLSANGLCFDALVKPRHLPHLSVFLDRYQDLKVVIDHGAKPEIINDGYLNWARGMQSIANNSHAFCKLSGLVTEAAADWTDDIITPYANHILNSFGSQRVMFGSDWPVLNMAGDYAGWLKLVESLLDDETRANVMGRTAQGFYLSR